MEARCEINRFVQAVAALTPCSPQLPSSFLTLSSCRLPTCSQRHFGYFFLISANSQAPPSSFISSPYQFFLPLPLLLPLVCWAKSIYSKLDPRGLISLTVYLFALCCLICWGVCPSVPIDKALGSLFILSHYLVTQGKVGWAFIFL